MAVLVAWGYCRGGGYVEGDGGGGGGGGGNCVPRRMGYFAGVPARFFETYQAVYHALLLRQRHALDKRGSYSFTSLKEIGEILADIRMLAFTFALHGELQGTVAGINSRTQFAGDLPWERWRAIEDSCESHRRMTTRLRSLRVWLRILVLVSPYVGNELCTMRRFWAAYCFSQHSRGFHSGGTWHLPAHLFQILFTGLFQGCELALFVRPPDGRTHHLHPACQCAARPRLSQPGLAPHVCVGRRLMHLPWWVAHTQLSLTELREDCRTKQTNTTLPRWQTLEATRADFGLRQRACSVPLKVAECLRCVDEGLLHAQRFWEDLRQQVEQYCLKDIGVSTRMQEIFASVSVAFWLEDAVSQRRPGPQHETALLTVYRHILPMLRQRPWPLEDFAMTPPYKQWPLPGEGIIYYYRRWWSKIYTAANTPDGPYRTSWRTERRHIVEPVHLPNILLRLAQLRLLHSRAKWCHVPRHRRFQGYFFAMRVQSFLSRPVASFPAQVEHIRKEGHGLGTLRTKHFRGHVVFIKSTEYAWDQLKIAASLEQSASFSDGCYHMNAMFAFVRRLGKTSSWCERWAKHFKWLYSDWQGPSSTTVIHRLQGRIGGLRGDGTDEDLLRQVSASLMPSDPTAPYRCQPRNANFRALQTWQDHCAKEANTRFSSILERAGAPADAAWAVDAKAGTALAADAKVGTTAPLSRMLCWKSAGRSRQRFEPNTMEPGDAMLLEKMGRRRVASMPWTARTAKEWDHDLNATRRDVMTSARAEAFFAKHRAGCVQPARELNAHTSSSSSSSGSSSSSSSEESDGVPLSAKPAPLSSTASVADAVSWVLPLGGKLHLRVDLVEGRVCTLCKPACEVKPGFQKGDSAVDAALTKAQWCRRCEGALREPSDKMYPESTKATFAETRVISIVAQRLQHCTYLCRASLLLCVALK